MLRFLPQEANIVASIGVREMSAAVRVLARGKLSRYASTGVSATRRLEDAVANGMGVRHALAVNSGTSALVAALAAAGIGPGDEVLVPAYTWVSTAAAPLAVGAVPVLVDIDESLTIDPIDMKEKITPHTKAVLPVHMLNLVSDMDAVMRIADEFSLVVIEDACQAIGASYHGKRVGTIGHAGAFSFNQQKNITSGEGGAFLTDDDRLYARAGMYHDVGSYSRETRFDVEEPLIVGMNFRMPELSAAILLPQLERLDRQMSRRMARRQALVEDLGGRSSFTISPHHDPAAAVGLAIHFDDPELAREAASLKGVHRLIDTGRHVYTNWLSIVEKRTFHEAMNPFRWAHRELDYTPETCPRTIEILERTCTVSLDPQVPTPLLRRMMRQLPA
jgi:dTDP-4-amino-4,6-dideoxygalactose transaminase